MILAVELLVRLAWHRAVEMGMDRLRVLAPEVGAGAERHKAAEVGDSADAAEIVFAPEASCLGLVDQAKQNACLAARGRKAIEPGQMVTAGGAKHRFRRLPNQRVL